MKRYGFVVALALCACNPNKTALDANSHPTERNWGSLQPVWRDEFDDKKGIGIPDPENWVVAQYCGGSNGEQQCYKPDNIVVSGGHLVITAKPQKCRGDPYSTAAGTDEVGQPVMCPSGPGIDEQLFSSGRLHTKLKVPKTPHGWRYGRIEFRAKLAFGTGTWSALWMMPLTNSYDDWPQSGEIDIVEAVNLHSPNAPSDAIESTIHMCSLPGNYTPNSGASDACDDLKAAHDTPTNPSPYQQVYFPKKLFVGSDANGCKQDLSKDFHTYALEWSDLLMRFYLDGQLIHTIAHVPDKNHVAPFQKPFYIIVNLAVGGAMTGFDHPINDPVPNPPTDWLDSPTQPKAQLVLDWVRVYECVPDPTAKNCMYKGDGLGVKPANPAWAVICDRALPQ